MSTTTKTATTGTAKRKGSVFDILGLETAKASNLKATNLDVQALGIGSGTFPTWR